jgi:hypothetical protein
VRAALATLARDALATSPKVARGRDDLSTRPTSLAIPAGIVPSDKNSTMIPQIIFERTRRN